MEGWKDVRDALGRGFALHDEGDRLRFDVEAPPARLSVTRTDVLGLPGLVLATYVCEEAQWNARAALSQNAGLSLGYLALDDGLVFLRCQMVLHALTRAALAQVVHAIARQGHFLRSTRAQARSDAGRTFFSHYAA